MHRSAYVSTWFVLAAMAGCGTQTVDGSSASAGEATASAGETGGGTGPTSGGRGSTGGASAGVTGAASGGGSGASATGASGSSSGVASGSGATDSGPGGTASTGGGATASSGTSGGSGSSTGVARDAGGGGTGGRDGGVGGATGGGRDGGSVATTGGGRDGGAATGSTGGARDGGVAGEPAGFFIGADITWVQQDQAGGAMYLDDDGTAKDPLVLLKDHGFNYIRLRTFVDPKASDGYSKQAGYADIAHTITFGQKIKAAGMGFLLDFHYSDNWADPGKQCIPVAWQGMTLSQMTQAVHDYTADSIRQLVAAGARPDMVQIGNEITPGMLIHICDGSGSPTSTNTVNGSTSNWDNLAGFLKAGIQGVKDVDPGIKIMLHIDRGNAATTSVNWIKNATSRGVVFDVFGESCYTAYQGQPSDWQNTFETLATQFPNLHFVIAEYGEALREANDVIFKLADQKGVGTFIWEPTHSGAWGAGLFTTSGRNYRTTPSRIDLYDQMKIDYAGR